jgi:ABC-2 type transport system ATP-binding protein
VRDARVRGATIFISSHVLSEVEQVCDRVGIVREGHLATVGQLDQLAGMRAHRVEILFAGTPPIDRIRALPGFEQVVVEDHRVSGMFRGDFEPLMAVLATSHVAKFESREPSLEEIFLGFYKKA